MIAEQPSMSSVEQARTESISLKRIVAALQVILATRRAASSDESKYWYTVARGM
jgi:hypothetical protein